MRAFLLVFTLLVMIPVQGAAHALAGLARAVPQASGVEDRLSGLTVLQLGLTQAVPYRIRALTDPWRIVIDFETVDFAPLPKDTFTGSDTVRSVRFGTLNAATARMVLELTTPMALERAVLTPAVGTEGRVLEVSLRPVSADAFAAQAIAPVQIPAPTDTASPPRPRNTGDRPWIIALDPGHGGIDLGADGGKLSEADLMLRFAYEFRDALRQTGIFDVILTRDRDVFVGLEARTALARASAADVFLSLHADAVTKGFAKGITLYKLSKGAEAEADAKLAERHDRGNIISGTDLGGQTDEVATLLLDLMRRETTPRTDALMESLIAGLREAGAVINRKPTRTGNFAVLRSADIPSVLVELGYLTSRSDRARLHNPADRAVMIAGLVEGLTQWAYDDAAKAILVRQ